MPPTPNEATPMATEAELRILQDQLVHLVGAPVDISVEDQCVVLTVEQAAALVLLARY